MDTNNIVSLFNEKLKEYEPYGYNEDNNENLYAHSDAVQALMDVFADIEKGLE